MLRRDQWRVRSIRLATLIAVLAGLFAIVATPSSADVTAVRGEAFGVSVPNLTIFGGVPEGVPFGPVPSVTLAADASNSPQTASDNDGVAAVFGPATIFSAGAVTVSTEGTLGAGGSVTSSADITNVNTSQSEIFTASGLQSSCTANETGVSGSTTITGGTIYLQDPDPDATGEEGEQLVTLEANPAPNTTFSGTIAPPVSDNFEVIFNEQVTNEDGSLTVTAYHLRMLGPTAIGDLYVGQVTCGVTATQTTTTTGPGGSTTTSQPGGSTTTTQPGGSTTTTQPGGSTTTTRPGGTTTTTRPGATTTTIRATTTTSTVAPASGGGGSGGTPSSDGKSLVRTGSGFQSLAVFAVLTLVLGAMVLIGFGGRLVGAGAGSATAPWVAAVRQAVERRRRRRPWNRRPWV